MRKLFFALIYSYLRVKNYKYLTFERKKTAAKKAV